MKLTITKKVFLLVAVPLCVGLTSTIALALFLQKIDVEQQKDTLARDTTAHLTALLGLTFRQAGFTMLVYALDLTPNQYKNEDWHEQASKDEIEALKKLRGEQMLQSNKLQHTIEQVELFNRKCKEEAPVIKSGNEFQSIAAWLKIQRVLKAVNAASEQVLEEQQKIIAERHFDENSMRSTFVTILLFASIGNVALGWVLMHYFHKTIVMPLRAVEQNTLKIAAGKELTPLTSLDAEMADLDSVFRSMADEIKEARLRERAVLDGAVDVICSIDHGGHIVEINPAGPALLGYEAEELLGLRLQRLIVPGDAGEVNAEISRLVDHGGKANFECRLVGKHGRMLHTEWSIKASNRAKVLFTIIRDVTRIKEIEQLKRDFVAMVSHDLRTPLTSIEVFYSSVEAGVYGSLSDQGLGRVGAAETNVELLLALVNDLLELERMESGQFPISTTPQHISRILDDVYDSTVGVAENSKIKLVTDFDEGFPRVKADIGRITQVLINLISNAVKFSPQGSSVTVSVVEEGPFAKFHVKDEGRGVPLELQATIFERFKQVTADDARVKKGAGLGLAICKAIVEQHGGSIGVVSHPGEGSDFWFTVPLDMAQKT